MKWRLNDSSSVRNRIQMEGLGREARLDTVDYFGKDWRRTHTQQENTVGGEGCMYCKQVSPHLCYPAVRDRELYLNNLHYST